MDEEDEEKELLANELNGDRRGVSVSLSTASSAKRKRESHTIYTSKAQRPLPYFIEWILFSYSPPFLFVEEAPISLCRPEKSFGRQSFPCYLATVVLLCSIHVQSLPGFTHFPCRRTQVNIDMVVSTRRPEGGWWWS